MINGTLPQLEAGEFGTIYSIDGSGLRSKRLADMGFVRGARLTMIRPGEPCLVRLGGRCVGLGLGHQENIQLGAD